MTTYTKLKFIQNHVKNTYVDPKIQRKKKRPTLTYLHTDCPSHRVSYKLTTNGCARFSEVLAAVAVPQGSETSQNSTKDFMHFYVSPKKIVKNCFYSFLSVADASHNLFFLQLPFNNEYFFLFPKNNISVIYLYRLINWIIGFTLHTGALQRSTSFKRNCSRILQNFKDLAESADSYYRVIACCLNAPYIISTR